MKRSPGQKPGFSIDVNRKSAEAQNEILLVGKVGAEREKILDVVLRFRAFAVKYFPFPHLLHV